jgi:hypothetical protein
MKELFDTLPSQTFFTPTAQGLIWLESKLKGLKIVELGGRYWITGIKASKDHSTVHAD